MTKVTISSCMCSFSHIIMGRVEGDKIIIKIETPCEKFKELTCLEFPLEELPENQSNLALEMEKQTDCSLACTRECALDCTRKCMIPHAVFNVCSIERELAEMPILESEEYTISELQ